MDTFNSSKYVELCIAFSFLLKVWINSPLNPTITPCRAREEKVSMFIVRWNVLGQVDELLLKSTRPLTVDSELLSTRTSFQLKY